MSEARRIIDMGKIVSILVLLLACAGSVPAQVQVAVIVHPDVPLETIDRSDLLDYYIGDAKSWPNDFPAVVLDLEPKGEVKDAFYKFLGKSTSRMKSIWMRNMLTGKGEPPEALESEAALLEKVASTPGAIGFVSPAIADSNVVKILRTISPNES